MSFNHKGVECQNCTKRFTSVFCKAENDSIDQINDQKVCTPYKKGNYIFHEGMRPQGVYCVNYGKIKLSKLGDDGKEQILRLVKPGDLLGYRSLLGEESYNASAVVMEDSGVCFIPKELFLGVLKRDGMLSMEMMRLLSVDLKHAEQSITHLAQKPVRERLAEALLFMKETYGFQEDEKTIDLKITREEIANLVGTATETAIRLMSDLKNEGAIGLEGKKIQIIDLPKLVKIANIND
jgi:CRP/FNR family transcriptional regulator, polysaccharide utilization system transcription regulator